MSLWGLGKAKEPKHLLQELRKGESFVRANGGGCLSTLVCACVCVAAQYKHMPYMSAHVLILSPFVMIRKASARRRWRRWRARTCGGPRIEKFEEARGALVVVGRLPTVCK
jgi:hypothetical protein